jgi:hypothetical protein
VQQLIDDLPVLQAKHYNAICAQALRADLSRGRTLVDIAKRLRERTDFVEACAARLGLRSPYRTGRKVARRRGTDRGRRNRTATLRA